MGRDQRCRVPAQQRAPAGLSRADGSPVMRDASDHEEKVAAAAQSAGKQRTEQLTDNEGTGQPGGEPTEQRTGEQAEQPGDKPTGQPGDEAAEQSAGGEPTGQPGDEAAEQSA